MESKACSITFNSGVLAGVDEYAASCGISRNAAVNLACSMLTKEADRLRKESAALLAEGERLREMVLKLAMVGLKEGAKICR
jgi:hypothetical protein